jgi:2-C-methyl-D-erythritol 4-phosphate cytidylyltransferase
MGGVDKIFVSLFGKPLLAYAIEVFQSCSVVDQIVLVLNEMNLGQGLRLVEEQGYSKVVGAYPGGKRRQDSVVEGLKRLENHQWVVIHDGARPCLNSGLIERGLKEAQESGAAIAAVPVKDTIKRVGMDKIVEETPGRESLWIAQTPQVFRGDIIEEAYRRADYEATDDAALVEALGYKVKVYMGSYDNIKVTTWEDIALAEIILRNRGLT